MQFDFVLESIHCSSFNDFEGKIAEEMQVGVLEEFYCVCLQTKCINKEMHLSLFTVP